MVLRCSVRGRAVGVFICPVLILVRGASCEKSQSDRRRLTDGPAIRRAMVTVT